MLSFHVKFVQTDSRTGKQYAPDLSMRGHKTCSTNIYSNLLPDDKILDWSKLKQTADNILKCI